ncbi:hypothetical protein PVOR_13504 [Paenibacillus vortex V453]|jgi:hypothetical protein|uniref:DUF4825 domain-containing protein n=2 Tax=Paenibacillus TaxID=44249 RepID=A0A163LF93_9BACL|nr:MULTISPECIES: hypothetical protein [Paenibacillus]ANA82034.1 hypothetical protein A3958_19575 [Paenibacillus glucanolyticus]AVV59229.1 hypothetical protein C7121_25460 [Paenibacillus glucanolyticus]AWP28400.1 hypothetical protein B9D94_18040 [Paenibacillus sp. Cedars]EFU41385.1 hypothetical protein PVOR_13504 [Paenibacillus vortex V453]ETT43470.1 hypothetical protein C169_02005 [Paenibacillus sp. FSL R5-808]
MKHWPSVRAVLVPAAIACMILALLISVQSQTRYKVGAVTAAIPYHSRELNDAGLVDALMELPLHLRISRADYDDGALTLDIKLNDQSDTVTDVYEDVASVMSFSFEGTDNVQQLYLRVIAIDRWGGKRYMLLASNMSRETWDPRYAEALTQLENGDMPPALTSSLNITFTNLWLKQFSSP